MKCPQCQVENPDKAKFCMECGHDLRIHEYVPPVDYSQPQTYTPKFLADKILTGRSSIEGERKLVTVLFADVADYTSITEKLGAEEVHEIMDGFFGVLADEIHRYEGTIDKFSGDGVMALFGAPVAHEDHAVRACHAALGLQRAVGKYGQKVKRDCGVKFRMRIGLNSGYAIIRSIGNDLRMDYAAVGNTTNLASRMQAKATPGAILLAEHTHELAKDFFEFKPKGKLQVKGIEEPQTAYELVRALEVETRFEAAVVKGLTKFVGREKEMRTLQEAFEKAQSGSGQVVGIVGEAGVGKSRLLLELREILPEEQHTYLEGQCLHYGGSVAYLPFLDILRSCFDIKEGDREPLVRERVEERLTQLDEKLKDAVPPLHDILSVKVKDEQYLQLAPQQRREKAFEAIGNLLIRESQKRSLVVAVEDLHWLDRTSEELLTYLMGLLASSRILLILLYRPEYTHQWGSQSCYSQISLDQLSAVSSVKLMQSILEGGEAEPELKELILSRAGGNPLFVEELTHNLLQNGTIQKEGHQYVLGRQASEVQVPETIQGIIAARMDRLEDNIRRTMQVASVIGRDFAFRILHAITGMQDELESYLLDLQRLEFIYEKSLFPELEYIFKHALIQEVAYETLLTKRRKELHERIGKAIEELYPDRLGEFYEMLAHHYSRSENLEKAYQYLKLSGEKAARSYSNWEALRFYKDAIKVLDKQPDTIENRTRGVEVRLLAAISMNPLAYPEDSLSILQDGERLARELGDRRSLANLYSNIGVRHTVHGDPVQGTRYQESAFKEAEKAGDLDLMAPIAFDLIASYIVSAQPPRVVELASKVLPLLESTRRQSEFFGRAWNVYAHILSNYGHAVGWMGNMGAGRILCDKALRLADEIDDVRAKCYIEMSAGYNFLHRGDGEDARERFENAIGHCQETQLLVVLGANWSGLGWAHYFLGDVKTAVEHLETAIRAQREIGIPYCLSIPYRVLAMIHFDSGDFKKATSCIEESLKYSQDCREIGQEGFSRIWLGRVLGKADKSQFAKAQEYILEGVKIVDELGIRPWSSQGHLFLGELYADMGQKGKALEDVRNAQGMFQEMGMDYWVTRAEGALKSLE